MKFYKDHYDVVIIGGALAGMSACLQLQAWGIKDILILEKHNMPGGLATDFMRNGFEIEATLHEKGTASFTTVMEAQTAWNAAQSQLIDAEIGVKLSEVELQKALGTLSN